MFIVTVDAGMPSLTLADLYLTSRSQYLTFALGPHEIGTHDHEAVEVDVALGGGPRPDGDAVVVPARRHQPERGRGAERRHAL